MAVAAVVACLAAEAAGRASQSQPPQRPPDIYYTPTRQAVAEAMLELAGVGPSDVVYDSRGRSRRAAARAGPGTRIVSQQFRLADWPPERSVVVEGAELFLWTVRAFREPPLLMSAILPLTEGDIMTSWLPTSSTTSR